VGRILEHQKLGVPLSQQAVLFRAAHHSILLEGALPNTLCRSSKYGGLKFVEAAHVKDLLSLIRLARTHATSCRAACAVPAAGYRSEEAAELLRELARGRRPVRRLVRERHPRQKQRRVAEVLGSAAKSGPWRHGRRAAASGARGDRVLRTVLTRKTTRTRLSVWRTSSNWSNWPAAFRTAPPCWRIWRSTAVQYGRYDGVRGPGRLSGPQHDALG